MLKSSMTSVDVEVVRGHDSPVVMRSYLAQQLLLGDAEEKLVIEYQQSRSRKRRDVAKLRRRSMSLPGLCLPRGWQHRESGTRAHPVNQHVPSSALLRSP